VLQKRDFPELSHFVTFAAGSKFAAKSCRCVRKLFYAFGKGDLRCTEADHAASTRQIKVSRTFLSKAKN